MAFDFKKEYKEFYLPPEKPVIVTVPKANYIAMCGKGDLFLSSFSQSKNCGDKNHCRSGHRPL